MEVGKYFWICPKCSEKVNAVKQLTDACFDEDDGEAYFEVDKGEGLFFHTIMCPKCHSHWIMSIGGMEEF